MKWKNQSSGNQKSESQKIGETKIDKSKAPREIEEIGRKAGNDYFLDERVF
jgi:hypothetical protein